ncbi:TadE/TadG family type IV pilus assembly protein [Rhodobacter sp. CZR27]|uniref:TadE/TadG family type IV pilus assembly protein n=1 Tax=Rhodobacter sp. CZR27 TaxID=2033869 RepID=UPI000BBE2703|nr:TadE family protein [Rhodobacter sp. CZR27]
MSPRLHPRWRDDGGNATVEFVLVFPVIIWIFFAAMESGLYMTRYVLFDRAVDMAMRDLRLGLIADPDAAKLKDAICNNAILVEDCATSLHIELVSIDTDSWDFPTDPVTCIDRSRPMAPVIEPDLGAPNEIMLVRACATMDAIFPTTGIAANMTKDGNGGYFIVSSSGFVNEP